MSKYLPQVGEAGGQAEERVHLVEREVSGKLLWFFVYMSGR